MKLGFFTMPIHPLDKDWRQSLREDREAFVLADKLGFVEGYVGEHATDRAENITSCALFIASLIDATKTIKLGTGTINMPNAHPVATASQIAMLDHMLDGRFIFGISPGGLLSDAEAFGNLDADRNAMFIEAINAVLEIWQREPPYNIEGKYWNIKIERQAMLEVGQGYLAKPLQKPHPPILVGATGENIALGIVARHAQIWNSFGTPDVFRHKIARLQDHCERIGRDPATIEKSVLLSGLFALNEARREIDAYAAAGVTHLIFSVSPTDRDFIRRFAREIIPVYKAQS